MPSSADVLASSLQHVADGYGELYLKNIPLFAYLLGKAEGEGASSKLNKFKLRGPYFEFILSKGGPGQSQTMVYGDETLRSTRVQNAIKGNEYAARHIYHYVVPNDDLMRAGTEQDFGKIIDSYPQQAVADDKAIVSRQIARGASAAASDPTSNGAGAIFTFNGESSYNPNGATRTGLFSYVAPASQTSTVHGIVKKGGTAGVAGWYNQYQHINSFATEGMKKYRTLVSTANRQTLDLEGSGVNLVCSDTSTFQNFLEALDDKITMIDKADYPLAKYLNRSGFRLDGVDWYDDEDIDITDTAAFTTATTQAGVAYVLNTSLFELFFHGGHPDMAGSGFFDMQDHLLLPDQDMWQFRIASQFNFVCKSLRNQGVITGGAQE